jgi:hypothetical protein
MTDVGMTEDTQIGGYGELHYNKSTKGNGSFNSSGVLDFHRFVIYVGHHFNSWIWFNSEIELEHTFIKGEEDTGELSIEQAFVNLQFHKNAGFRAGIMLVPLGLVNPLHEPPTFHGVERPNVEKYIIPSTWREAGAGLGGSISRRFRYEAYLMAGLDPDGIDGKNGIRGARQKGFESSTQDFSLAARIDYLIKLYLTLGGGFYYSTLEKSAEYGNTLKGASFTLIELHSKFNYSNLQIRFLMTYSTITEAEKLNNFYADTLGFPQIGSAQMGTYIEVAYDLFGFLRTPLEQRLFTFIRYEFYDTHRKTTGFEANPAYERKETTVGITYLPVTNVCLKLDYQFLNTGDNQKKEQFNLGLGYNF